MHFSKLNLKYDILKTGWLINRVSVISEPLVHLAFKIGGDL